MIQFPSVRQLSPLRGHRGEFSAMRNVLDSNAYKVSGFSSLANADPYGDTAIGPTHCHRFHTAIPPLVLSVILPSVPYGDTVISPTE